VRGAIPTDRREFRYCGRIFRLPSLVRFHDITGVLRVNRELAFV